MTDALDKTYRPAAIEQSLYRRWEKAGWFEPAGNGAPYCIMIPPPNVTGTLHMGHAFQDTIMDALTRYHRMAGDRTLWQPGTDHAGIATQMVVERQLEAEGKTRHDLGREAFVARVWEWKAKSGNRITEQLRRMGASVDWTRERFTMDEGLSRAVVEVFVRLYDEGLIYRGKRLVNWDPVLHTALSDLEVLSTEESGNLWHFRYPLSDGTGHVTVATTRPETMLGDTAVAVHPEDERYRGLIGCTVQLPLTDREIPIIADEYVDPEFGTGCVKITPAHDFNDYDIGTRHDLDAINIFDASARLNDNAPEAYRGLDRFDARSRIVDDMEALDLLAGIDDHALMVPRGDRSGAVVEPYLTDQWYVRAEPLARPAIEAVETGAIRFVPENWSKTYFEWMYNIQDWCISRQLWWGHRIPAWYGPDGTIYVGRDEADARRRHEIEDTVELRQDGDVLDTWFSSALWPFSTLGWPEQSEALKTFYPTNVLVTGFDIIFFWVARMIMMGLKFAGDVPFREVYITGLVKDEDGHKMSKSRGNVLDPIDLIDGIGLEALVAKRTSALMQTHLKPRIEKATRRQFPNGIPEFGVDAVRYTFAALASTSRDIRFDLARVEGYRNFCNKIWNAARYVIMSTADETPTPAAAAPGLADRWICGRFKATIGQVRRHFDTYRFDLAAQELYDFTWHEFCDWYLELSKPVLRDRTSEAAAATRQTLLRVLEALVRAIHPLMPFITETIWLQLGPRDSRGQESIMLAPYPSESEFDTDPDADGEIEWIKGFLTGIRQIRGEMDVAPGRELPVLLQDGNQTDLDRAMSHREWLCNLGRLSDISPLGAGDEAPAAATALLGQLRLLVPLAGVIDIEAERSRLTRNLEKARAEAKRLGGKLANNNFVSKAPSHVVEKEQEKLNKAKLVIAQLDEQLENLARIDQ